MLGHNVSLSIIIGTYRSLVNALKLIARLLQNYSLIRVNSCYAALPLRSRIVHSFFSFIMTPALFDNSNTAQYHTDDSFFGYIVCLNIPG